MKLAWKRLLVVMVGGVAIVGALLLTLCPISKGGRLRGYLRECGGRKELLAPGGQVLGIYLMDKDHTIRPGGGGFVGYGDLLMTLLED